MFSLFLRQFTCPLPLADSLHLSRLRAGLSHMEFSNRSSLRAQGPITPGLESEKRPLLECRSESLRRRDERFALTLGSLRSQGRPAERLYEATTDQRTAQFSHMRFPCPQGGESRWEIAASALFYDSYTGNPFAFANSFSDVCGRAPMCWITSAAASAPSRPAFS